MHRHPQGINFAWLRKRALRIRLFPPAVGPPLERALYGAPALAGPASGRTRMARTYKIPAPARPCFFSDAAKPGYGALMTPSLHGALVPCGLEFACSAGSQWLIPLQPAVMQRQKAPVLCFWPIGGLWPPGCVAGRTPHGRIPNEVNGEPERLENSMHIQRISW